MESICKGRTVNGEELVIAVLSDSEDVFRLLNSSEEAAPGYKFSRDVHTYMRFYNIEGSMYLLMGNYPEDICIGREELHTYYADEVEEYLSGILEGYEYEETREGLYRIILNDIKGDNLKCVFEKFMNPDMDFNLVMPEGSVHMSWMPVLMKEKYCLEPVITPTYVNGWDTKVIEDTIVTLY